MPRLLKIPSELLVKNPGLTIREIRCILMVILNSRANVLRQSNVVDIKIPGLGRIKSHGNKRRLKRKKRTKLAK